MVDWRTPVSVKVACDEFYKTSLACKSYWACRLLWACRPKRRKSADIEAAALATFSPYRHRDRPVVSAAANIFFQTNFSPHIVSSQKENTKWRLLLLFLLLVSTRTLSLHCAVCLVRPLTIHRFLCIPFRFSAHFRPCRFRNGDRVFSSLKCTSWLEIWFPQLLDFYSYFLLKEKEQKKIFRKKNKYFFVSLRCKFPRDKWWIARHRSIIAVGRTPHLFASSWQVMIIERIQIGGNAKIRIWLWREGGKRMAN